MDVYEQKDVNVYVFYFDVLLSDVLACMAHS